MTARPENTYGSGLICGVIFAAALCAVLFVSSAVFADDGWNAPTKLYTLSYDSSDGAPVVDENAWIELTPSYQVMGSNIVYNYVLDNSNTDENVSSFALTFTGINNAAIQFNDFTPQAGWGHYDASGYVDGTPFSFQFSDGRELIWYAPDGGGLAPGQSMSFSFETTLPPGNAQSNIASGMGLARGYNGYTYGPMSVTGPVRAVPELPSALLGCSGLGCVRVIGMCLIGRIKKRVR